jgi:hypothetical protein
MLQRVVMNRAWPKRSGGEVVFTRRIISLKPLSRKLRDSASRLRKNPEVGFVFFLKLHAKKSE